MKRRDFLASLPILLVGGITSDMDKLDLNVCMGVSNHSKCRYLGNDNEGDGKHRCLKLSEEDRQIIDEEVADYLKFEDREGGQLPLGDNCLGKPITAEA